tara:strand:+ start:455 stop:1192 length:738 start_codon:yes stop_codon:yes gene_type:complete
MGIKRGSITTSIVADGLVLNMDAANRVSTIPDTNTTKTFNTVNTAVSGTLSSTGMFDSSTVTPSLAYGGTDNVIGSRNYPNEILGDADRTISIWCKTNSNTSTTYFPYQLGNTDSSFSPTRSKFAPLVNSGGAQHLRIYRMNADSSTLDWSSTFPDVYITDGNWHNLVVDYSNLTSNIYVDGQLLGQCTFSDALQTQVGFNIGRWAQAGGFWVGNLNNFLIYNRVLSTSEVLHNYNALKGRFGLS